MTKNMGNLDRGIRVAIAALLVGIMLMNGIGGMLAIIMGVVAGVLTLTSLVSLCPLYTLIGINTCRIEKG